MLIEQAILGGTQEENNKQLDNPLEWESSDSKRMSRIKYEKANLNAFEKEVCPEIIQFVTYIINAFDSAFKN